MFFSESERIRHKKLLAVLLMLLSPLLFKFGLAAHLFYSFEQVGALTFALPWVAGERAFAGQENLLGHTVCVEPARTLESPWWEPCHFEYSLPGTLLMLALTFLYGMLVLVLLEFAFQKL